MAQEEAKATANLKRTTALTAKMMMKRIQQAIADMDELIVENVTQNPYGWLDARGGNAYSAIDSHFKRLRKDLDGTLASLTRTAAKKGNTAAIAQSGGVLTQFNEEHLHAYLDRVTPRNAPSLAAVYTTSMSASAKAALRATVLSVFPKGAATGMTMREMAKQFQTEWAIRSKSNNPFRFIDKAGRAWENARYIQMLTRTTAQRVETAAFCDSMLADGFPLARISNDTDHDCGVCAEWEGRLIDLSQGHQLGKGSYTLQEAREAGLFHPNCMHRLEYVSIAEYPPEILEKIKDKIGKKNAFGDNKTATKPDLQTDAQRKEHIRQVEKAAEEKAKEGCSGIIRKELEEKGVILDKSLNNIDQKLLNMNTARLNELLDKYPIIQAFVKEHGLKLKAKTFRSNRTAGEAIRPTEDKHIEIALSKQLHANYENVIKIKKHSVRIGHSMPCAESSLPVYTLTHEFGHVVQFALEAQYLKEHPKEIEDALNDSGGSMTMTNTYAARKVRALYDNITIQNSIQIRRIVREIDPNSSNNDIYQNISMYATTSASEFFAEAFANSECGKVNIVGKAMRIFLERSQK